MKTKLLLLLTCIFCVSIYGQEIGWENHIISDNVDGAHSVFAADIDGDGDMDVISASSVDDKINWYENTDGQGEFKEHYIGFASFACSVYPADIDGDGDMDVVAASWGDDKIAWWENADGLGAFVEHIITTSADVARSVFCADIDGDGDMDVVAAYMGDDIVAWWENTDGQGTFVEYIIATNEDGARIVKAADLDNDGYMDVVAAILDAGKIVWYKNTDGNGRFVKQPTIMEDPNGAWTVNTGDINGDGNIDVIAAVGDSSLVWCENNGQGVFTVHDEVFSSSSSAEDLHVVDIDGDGDKDVISAEVIPNKVVWWENLDGQGGDLLQWSIKSLASNAKTVHYADINDDGLMDVISGWWSGDTVAWHENLGPTAGVDDNMLSDFAVYPNPTTGILTVQSKTAIVQIEIHNLLGQLVLSNTNQNTIDISNVSQGVYFIKVMGENGGFGAQKVVKE